MRIRKEASSIGEANAVVELAILSVLGHREEQQDAAGYKLLERAGMAVVCDGMGGHEGGRLASTTAVNDLVDVYANHAEDENIRQIMLNGVADADRRIAAITHPDGSPMRCGSTVVLVLIQEKKLYWIAAGDSRLYLYRGGELVQATQDHTLRLMLEEGLAAGRITPEDYQTRMAYGEALVSFLGVGGLPRIDANPAAFELKAGDRILLCTDGLYKLLPDEEITRILLNFRAPQDAVRALEKKVRRAAKKQKISRDNMTVALLKVK